MVVRYKVPRMLSLLLLFSLAASQNPEHSVPDQSRERRTSDPVSNFFSELGDLILDVDQTIAVQNQPKIEHEANVMSQLFRPRSDYFNRIQNNYQEMQKRLGKLIGNTIGFRNSYSDHELSTVSPPPENFNPTIGPDYNPFAEAAEARKEKLKQRISKGSFEPKSSIPQTIDESLKAFGKLSQAIIDNIGEFSIERKPSKSVGDKKLSPKRTGSIGYREECDNEVLEDPDLEKRRQEKCSQIAAEEQARERLRKLMKEPKRVTEALLSKSTDTLDKLTKDIIGRSGDAWIENDSKEGSISLQEECSNEVLEDPDLEKRRQEKCSQIAAEEQARERLRKLMKEPKRVTEALLSKSTDTLDKLTKDIIGRSGDAWIENDSKEGSISLQEECSNEVLEDPDLEQRRQERCSRIAAEERVREDWRKLMKEPKRATEALLSKSTDQLDKLTKGILGRSGDAWIENGSQEESMDLKEECANEVLEDPDLEKRRQERCSQIAAEERLRENLRKMMKEPKRVTEALYSKNMETFDMLTKDILSRTGDAWIKNDLAKSTDDMNSEVVEHGEASTDECSDLVFEDVSLENARREKCSRIAAEERFIKYLSKLLKDPIRASQKWVPVDSKAIDDLSTFIRRSGDMEDKSSGNILSDVSLDKQIRQLIKDHGSWILDYPLLKRWRQRDTSIESDTSTEPSSEVTEHTTVGDSDIAEVEPTEFYMPVSTDYEMALQKSGEIVSLNPQDASYYRIVNQDGDIMEEDIDFVLHPESLSNEIQDIEPKETVILAFTSDGVPLKLRVGPEIDNPIQYLHKVLQSAGVSLNIPVESYDDLEPVGKEVLKLGSGILTRAVLIDASNSNELKSLLKALMVTKTTGKTRF